MGAVIFSLALASLVAALPAAVPAVINVADASTVHYLGRINPATKELSWPSTGVMFNFTGTTAIIGVASTTGDNSADLWVDGGAPTVIANVTGSITIPTLPYGTHSVMVRKRSEANFGSIFISSVLTDGKTTKSTLSKRQIEYIGDSITVGYGMDGVFPCINTAALEDNPKTYAALAAEQLDAEYSVVAWSGRGVIRNYVTTTLDPSPVMPELWTRYGANDADDSYTFPSTWNPQAVVINLGTNDFSYAGSYANGTLYPIRIPINPYVFTEATLGFVEVVQSHYPTAHIFLMGSPLLSDGYPPGQAQKTTHSEALKQVAALAGKKVSFVEWPTQGSVVGCDYHPNAATNAAEAPVLAAAISAALGW